MVRAAALKVMKEEYVVGLIVYDMVPQLAVTDDAVKTVLETGDLSTVVVMSLMEFKFHGRSTRVNYYYIQCVGVAI